MVDPVTEINKKLLNSIFNVNWFNIIFNLILFSLIIFSALFVYYYYKNKKLYNKRITVFEMIGGYWYPTIRDTARIVKIGKGGYEVLYLKNLKVYRVAYGGRILKNDYYFFVMPDGYWYNGMLKGGINYLDENKGLVPVTTANPLMRGQYVALEKQIETLHGDTKSFLEKYGTFIFSIVFLLIAGVFLWLMFKEFSTGMKEITTAVKEMSQNTKVMAELVDKVNSLLKTAQSIQGGGLKPI